MASDFRLINETQNKLGGTKLYVHVVNNHDVTYNSLPGDDYRKYTA